MDFHLVAGLEFDELGSETDSQEGRQTTTASYLVTDRVTAVTDKTLSGIFFFIFKFLINSELICILIVFKKYHDIPYLSFHALFYCFHLLA